MPVICTVVEFVTRDLEAAATEATCFAAEPAVKAGRGTKGTGFFCQLPVRASVRLRPSFAIRARAAAFRAHSTLPFLVSKTEVEPLENLALSTVVLVMAPSAALFLTSATVSASTQLADSARPNFLETFVAR